MIADPRPLTGEPLPLDLLNTVWVDDAGTHDLLADRREARRWLDGHGFTAAPDTPAALRVLRGSREQLRALLRDRTADEPREAVNTLLRRGSTRTVLDAQGRPQSEACVAPTWEVPWRCAAVLVTLLGTHGSRIRPCGNPECVLWFLDVSRPGSRRWCSMAGCGNHAKAVRHGRVRASAP